MTTVFPLILHYILKYSLTEAGDTLLPTTTVQAINDFTRPQLNNSETKKSRKKK